MAQMTQRLERVPIAQVPKNFRTVITAAAGGNVIEWYDFYIFGSLAATCRSDSSKRATPSPLCSAPSHCSPPGSWSGRWEHSCSAGRETWFGRKYTFLMTLVGMALGTGAIGLIRPSTSWLAAAVILFCLRMIQGLCLAANMAAPSPTSRSTCRTNAAVRYRLAGDLADPWHRALAHLIIATRTYFGEAEFNASAWRLPFSFLFVLVLIAVYIRLQFQELPVYAEIKAKGETSKNPWSEAFLNPAYLKYVVIATIVVLGQGVVWYSGQFLALYFLQHVSKVDALTTAYIVGAGLIIGTPSLIFFGRLSDIIGRKP